MDRYHIAAPHAKRVRDTALGLLAQVAQSWRLQSPEDRLLLAWAADLHEIGMDIAHNQYHRHGGYLLAHMDLPGFSRLDQSQLATLVRLHRRKFAVEDASIVPEIRVLRLAVLLRLAVVLHRSRSTAPLPHIAAAAENGQVRLTLPKPWLDKHPLTPAGSQEGSPVLAEFAGQVAGEDRLILDLAILRGLFRAASNKVCGRLHARNRRRCAAGPCGRQCLTLQCFDLTEGTVKMAQIRKRGSTMLNYQAPARDMESCCLTFSKCSGNGPMCQRFRTLIRTWCGRFSAGPASWRGRSWRPSIRRGTGKAAVGRTA